MSAEYRIEFTIQRRTPDDDDFTDIGFGSSGTWDTVSAAADAVDATVTNWMWETEDDMPAPDIIKADHER